MFILPPFSVSDLNKEATQNDVTTCSRRQGGGLRRKRRRARIKAAKQGKTRAELKAEAQSLRDKKREKKEEKKKEYAALDDLVNAIKAAAAPEQSAPSPGGQHKEYLREMRMATNKIAGQEVGDGSKKMAVKARKTSPPLSQKKGKKVGGDGGGEAHFEEAGEEIVFKVRRRRSCACMFGFR